MHVCHGIHMLNARWYYQSITWVPCHSLRDLLSSNSAHQNPNQSTNLWLATYRQKHVCIGKHSLTICLHSHTIKTRDRILKQIFTQTQLYKLAYCSSHLYTKNCTKPFGSWLWFLLKTCSRHTKEALRVGITLKRFFLN